jgi:hypothetical protein
VISKLFDKKFSKKKYEKSMVAPRVISKLFDKKFSKKKV